MEGVILGRRDTSVCEGVSLGGTGGVLDRLSMEGVIRETTSGVAIKRVRESVRKYDRPHGMVYKYLRVSPHCAGRSIKAFHPPGNNKGIK